MKSTQKVKKYGIALIYVILIMIPVLFIALSLIDLVSTDFMVSYKVFNGNQSLYNAESGITNGIKRLQIKEFQRGYKDNFTVALDDLQNSQNYYNTVIKSNGEMFQISSMGFYKGSVKRLNTDIDRELLLNLNRKFMAGQITSPGRVVFRISPLNWETRLKKYEKILLLNQSGLMNDGNIYYFFSGENISTAVKGTRDVLICTSIIKNDKIKSIKADSASRKKWLTDGNDIMYYIGAEGENFKFDLEKIKNADEAIYKGFREYGNTVTEDNGIISKYIRILFIDGDIDLTGIKGDYIGNQVSNAQMYLDNLIIYCTGKVTIKDCEIQGYNNGLREYKDIDISIVSDRVEFSSDNLISYQGPNDGLIKNKVDKIIDVIRKNTDIYSNWVVKY
ncbi:hypothetical protein Q428_01400 [Fervidicella metallireducens AeB]|uniref:Uncharacterized protein n=1 Tax=Fervidicella metallireducens AeB TaxID=1403537 RepID=A0A017RYR6_9CLOT|nr:hypothetical protein [Fervidicella metallireducens]EYE89736.1 hypothetical protein Q428_01400 [Fervidicella metallireducens AeB]